MQRGTTTAWVLPNELYGVKTFTNYNNLDNLYFILTSLNTAQLPILSQENHGELKRTTAADSWSADDRITD